MDMFTAIADTPRSDEFYDSLLKTWELADDEDRAKLESVFPVLKQQG